MERSLKSDLTCLLCIKFNEFYMRNTDAQYNNLFGKWVHIIKTARVYRGTKRIIGFDMVACLTYTQKNVLLNQQKFGWPNKVFRLNTQKKMFC